MITDEELSELPEDPELAFVQFESIMRKRTEGAIEDVMQTQFGSSTPLKREYINRVLAAATEFDVETLRNWSIPSPTEDADRYYESLTSAVDHYTTKIRIRNAPRSRKKSVGLDGNSKTKIHHYIDQIRTVIQEAELPEAKREALFAKLNALAAEVDKGRTTLQSLTDVWLAISGAIGEGFKKMEPARRCIDSIANLMGKAKEAEENLPSLPAGSTAKRIEGPAKRLPAPPANPADVDDEIPF